MQPIGDLEALYHQHASAVFRFAFGLSRNRADAEDIVSETFARVATRANKIAHITARAYLLAVARNTFLDTQRRHAREARVTREMAPELQNPESLQDDRARLATALKALGAIPEGERAAFLLRVDNDLSYGEIALTLGISVVAAKVRVHRARVRLANAARTGEQDDEV